jgi:hypothetical protein
MRRFPRRLDEAPTVGAAQVTCDSRDYSFENAAVSREIAWPIASGKLATCRLLGPSSLFPKNCQQLRLDLPHAGPPPFWFPSKQCFSTVASFPDVLPPCRTYTRNVVGAALPLLQRGPRAKISSTVRPQLHTSDAAVAVSENCSRERYNSAPRRSPGNSSPTECRPEICQVAFGN